MCARLRSGSKCDGSLLIPADSVVYVDRASAFAYFLGIITMVLVYLGGTVLG